MRKNGGERMMKKLPMAEGMELAQIVGEILSKKCEDASAGTFFDYAMEEHGQSFCSLSRQYSFECPYKSDVDIVVRHGDGQQALYKKCSRELWHDG